MTLLRGRDAGDGFGGGGGQASVQPARDGASGPRGERRGAWREAFLGGSAYAEQQLFRNYARTMRAVQARVRGRGGPHQQTLRGLHARMLAGTTLASLLVDSAELSGGYLREGEQYRVSLRFSSASSRPGPDSTRDLRGIALRVHTREGGCDLLLTNAEVSHVRDADEFMAFTSAMAHGRLLGSLLLCVGRPWRGPRMLIRAREQVSHPARSLAGESFWSRAPFLLEQTPVRYVLRPDRVEKLTCKRDAPDYLFDDLRTKLARGTLRFGLWAQPYQDEPKTPLEDSSRPWQSRERRIATLVLDQQQLPEPSSAAFRAIDALRFSPWNTLPSMRPLGSLNRARKQVYAASQGERSRPEPVSKSRLLGGALRAVESMFSLVNTVVPWHRLPTALGVANLIALRERFRRESLTTLDDPTHAEPLVEIPSEAVRARTFDGRFNDPVSPLCGAKGARFARNGAVTPSDFESDAALRRPDPRTVSERLLKRERFLPAPTLNLLAVAWIQFQAHDWFKHREAAPSAAPGSAREQLARELGVYPTLRAEKRSELDRELPPAHENEATHWWDCSQLYGTSPAQAARLRGHDGTLELDRGLLPVGPKRLPETGDSSNWWIGLEVMHTLFAREHNAICAALKREHPSWGGDRLFEVARLVNVAAMTKIHTVEWTPALLAHDTLRAAMRAHWDGLVPTRTPSRKRPKSELLYGIPGSDSDHYEVPYALTEEFVAVYRLHPMLPDQIALEPLPGSAREPALAFAACAFEQSPTLARSRGLDTLAHALGLGCAGRMSLHNYPEFLRRLPARDTRTSEIDLGAVDIFRDRERGVARYNAFRQQFGLARKASFSELASEPATQRELEALYGSVDEVDLLVGLLAETPPSGFGISDTAFRVFLGMASRRLKADRFITAAYREEFYTETGLRWIEQSSFKAVLMRHLPALHAQLSGVAEPFAPWPALPI